MAGPPKFLLKFRTHHHGLWIFAASFFVAAAVTGVGENAAVRGLLTFIGILFGLLIGFTLTFLWRRFQRIRESVARETSSFMNYFQLAQKLGTFKEHQEWAKKQADLIDEYMVAWIPEEWGDYHKADPKWHAILDSVKELKIEKGQQGQIYSRILQSTMNINNAREELNVLGKNRMPSGLWWTLFALAGIFLFNLFYLNVRTIESVFFTALLSTVVIVLLLVMRDLNDLHFSEEVVSFEPYERVLDFVGKPRFYPQRLIEAGRIKMHKGKEHRVY